MSKPALDLAMEPELALGHHEDRSSVLSVVVQKILVRCA
jgi:hypothetical protein